VPGLPFIGAYGVVVESLDRLETILQRVSARARRIDASLIVPFPEELGQGAWIFTENAALSPFR
jgi:hypothetical protein